MTACNGLPQRVTVCNVHCQVLSGSTPSKAHAAFKACALPPLRRLHLERRAGQTSCLLRCGVLGRDAVTSCDVLRATPPQDFLIANAGAAIALSGKVPSADWAAGAAAARAAIEDGTALATLDRYVAYTQGCKKDSRAKN